MVFVNYLEDRKPNLSLLVLRQCIEEFEYTFTTIKNRVTDGAARACADAAAAAAARPY